VFSSGGLPISVTHGAGTSLATTETFTYDHATGNKLTATDGDGHTTTYAYDANGNRKSITDPEGHKTEWTWSHKCHWGPRARCPN